MAQRINEERDVLIYLVILFVIVLLGGLSYIFWRKRSCPSKQTVETIQKGVSEHITLGQWEASYQKLKPLLENHLGGERTTALHAQIMRGIRQYDLALQIVDDALGVNSENLSLIHERAKVMLEKGDFNQALSDLLTCQAILRTEEDMLDLATAYFQAGKVNEAWLYLADYLHQTKNGRLLALAGDCQFFWGNWEQATAIYFKAQECGWSNSRLISRIGYSLYSIGHVEEASHYFHQILAEDSSDKLATLGIGAAFESREEYEKALITYQSGKAWEQADPHILQRAGVCAARLNLYKFAELYFKEAMAKGGVSPELLTYLAYSYERERRFEEAEALYKELIQEYPDHPAGYRGLSWLFGVGLSTAIDSEAALAIARQSVEMQSDEASWEILSACEARVGNYEAAHSIQERLASHDSSRYARQKRQQAMRTLRRGKPLDETQVSPILVA